MINARTCVAVVFVGAVGFGLGCKKASEAGPGGDGAAAGAAADESDVLGLYVHCFNEVEHRVQTSWRGYTKWVDPKVGPTGTEKAIDGISTPDDYHTGKCLENLTTAVAHGAGSGPLAAPTKAYQASLTALLPLVTEAKAYYEHKDYKDDGFAKGKELHAKLVAAFTAWDAANDALRATWEERHRAARDQQLVTLEKEHGRKSELFVTAQVMNTAEELIEAVTAAAPAAPAVQAAIKKYQAAFEELSTFFGPALTASVDTDRYMFKDSADGLLVQTKEAARALDAGKPAPGEGDGSTDKLLEAYNELVKTSNDITWD